MLFAVCAYGGMATILAFLVEKIILVQKVQVYENAGIFNSSYERKMDLTRYVRNMSPKGSPFLNNLLELDINENNSEIIENFLKN